MTCIGHPRVQFGKFNLGILILKKFFIYIIYNGIKNKKSTQSTHNGKQENKTNQAFIGKGNDTKENIATFFTKGSTKTKTIAKIFTKGSSINNLFRKINIL